MPRASATQAESLDELGVAAGVLFLQVVEQATALIDHADQSATGVVIFPVLFEVALKGIDISRE